MVARGGSALRQALAIAGLCLAASAGTAHARTDEIDASFGNGGQLTLSSVGAPEVFKVVTAVAADGGTFIVREVAGGMSIARLDPSGVPVASYAGGGIARISLAKPFSPSAAHVSADGSLVVGGGLDLIRIDRTGRIDESFGDAGRMRIPYVDESFCRVGEVRHVLPAADGSWIAVGRFFGRTYLTGVQVFEGGCTFVAKVSSDGKPDLAFGTNGNTARGDFITFDAAMRGDGGVELIGRYKGRAGSWVERLRADGRMLETYGLRGSLKLPDNGGRDIVGIAGRILPDGSRIFVSDTPYSAVVALHRYRADDTFEPQFAALGRTVIPLREGFGSVTDVLPTPDGGFVVHAGIFAAWGYYATFQKIDARGLVDRSFGGEGYVRQLGEQYSWMLAWTVQPDGHVVYVGLSTSGSSPAVKVYATRMRAIPDIVEFRNTLTGHYFIAYDGLEASAIDDGAAGSGWVRTAQGFRPGGTSPVCRFYNPGANSHFFTAEPAECEEVKRSAGWIYEGLGFYATRIANGGCAAPLVPVHRFYNNRAAFNDSNHRYVTDLSVLPAMQSQGWSLEGVVFCAKP